MFKKVNSKLLAYTILLIVGVTFFLTQLITIIERPYLEKMREGWYQYPAKISATQVGYTTLLVNLTVAIAFLISLVVMVLYMCFAKHKFWRELWIAYFILVVIRLSNATVWFAIKHQSQPKPGWHTTVGNSPF